MNNLMSGTSTSEKRYIDGTHNFLMGLEDLGFKPKYCVDVLWSEEINRVVRITIDKSIVIGGELLNSLGIDLTNKHCQSVTGNSPISGVLDKYDPWFVLTSDLVDKMKRGVYTLCVNELRPRLVSYPNPDELFPLLSDVWGFAKDIGAEVLILTRNLRHNDTFIEAILVDNKGAIISAIEVQGLFHQKFKSSKHYELFKKQFYRAFKAYIDLGDYYIITPTEVKPDGNPLPVEPLEETSPEPRARNHQIIGRLNSVDATCKKIKHSVEDQDKIIALEEASKETVVAIDKVWKETLDKVSDSMMDQDKIIALENCFYTWDGQCDKDVIIQGIFDRYKALNKPLATISVERRTLNNVVICAIIEGSDNNPVELFNFKRTSISQHDLDFFHLEELKFMEKWLFENFYH